MTSQVAARRQAGEAPADDQHSAPGSIDTDGGSRGRSINVITWGWVNEIAGWSPGQPRNSWFNLWSDTLFSLLVVAFLQIAHFWRRKKVEVATKAPKQATRRIRFARSCLFFLRLVCSFGVCLVSWTHWFSLVPRFQETQTLPSLAIC